MSSYIKEVNEALANTILEAVDKGVDKLVDKAESQVYPILKNPLSEFKRDNEYSPRSIKIFPMHVKKRKAADLQEKDAIVDFITRNEIQRKNQIFTFAYNPNVKNYELYTADRGIPAFYDYARVYPVYTFNKGEVFKDQKGYLKNVSAKAIPDCVIILKPKNELAKDELEQINFDQEYIAYKMPRDVVSYGFLRYSKKNEHIEFHIYFPLDLSDKRREEKLEELLKNLRTTKRLYLCNAYKTENIVKEKVKDIINPLFENINSIITKIRNSIIFLVLLVLIYRHRYDIRYSILPKIKTVFKLSQRRRIKKSKTRTKHSKKNV